MDGGSLGADIVRAAPLSGMEIGMGRRIVSADRARQEQATKEMAVIRWAKWSALGACAGAIAGLAAIVGLIFQLRSGEEAIVEANRAWVVPQGPVTDITPIPGKSVMVRFGLQNVGREPAFRRGNYVSFDVVSTSESQKPLETSATRPPSCDAVPDELPPPIYPAQGLSTGFFAQTGANGVVWTNALATGTQTLRARGCVSYYTFGVRHFTWFCNVFTPAMSSDGTTKIWAGINCHGGNGAD